MRRATAAAAGVLVLVAGLVLASPAGAAGHDSDRDGMPDRWGKAHGLDWRKPNARGDTDQDGYTNLMEFRLGLDPRRADQQCTDLQVALGADDPSECGSVSLTQVLRRR